VTSRLPLPCSRPTRNFTSNAGARGQLEAAVVLTREDAELSSYYGMILPSWPLRINGVDEFQTKLLRPSEEYFVLFRMFPYKGFPWYRISIDCYYRRRCNYQNSRIYISHRSLLNKKTLEFQWVLIFVAPLRGLILNRIRHAGGGTVTDHRGLDHQRLFLMIGFPSKPSRISSKRRLRKCASLKLPRY
jgi:hypothetical protein